MSERPAIDITPAIDTLVSRLVHRVAINARDGQPLPSQADTEARMLIALCAAASASCAQQNVRMMQQFVDSWLTSYGGKGITS